jgi:hypothetical protein
MDEQTKKIEYYLGKDKFKDIYFKTEFPHAYQDIKNKEFNLDFKSKTLNFNKWYPEISFTINNLGYRSNIDYTIENLKNKKIILCLGCTDTFGMHLTNEETWPYILGNLNKDCLVLNCGIIGASADTISRVLTKILNLEELNIDAVCIFWPHNNRREFVSKEYTKIITSFNVEDVPFDEYWDFIDWRSDNYNFFKNYHLCQYLCKSKEVKFLDLLINRFDKKVPFDHKGKFYALGPKSHIAIANYFFKKLSNDS